MWIIQALAEDFEVTLYTRGGFELDNLNMVAGTSVTQDQYRLIIADSANAWPVGTIAHGSFLRSLRSVSDDFDLRVTASGVMHWGKPALHFISSVIWNPPLTEQFAPTQALGTKGVAHRVAWWIARGWSGQWTRSLNKDTFIANSNWTAQQSKPYCSGPMHVISPPVTTLPHNSIWATRKDGVLVFGRVSPEKQIEKCIEIVEGVRASGYPLTLCIAGPDGDPEYAKTINSLCFDRRSWIERVQLVVGSEKQSLLNRYRYGLSSCEIEAFGISTVEMVMSGMVVFVPEAGAQREIIKDPRQRFDTVHNAIERLVTIIRSEKLQQLLHASTFLLKDDFHPRSFIQATRLLAAQICADSQSA